MIGALDQSAIHVDETTGKSKGVDLFRVHDVEVPVQVGATGFAGDRLSEILDVAADGRIGDDRELSVDLFRILATEGNLLILGYGTSDNDGDARNQAAGTNHFSSEMVNCLRGQDMFQQRHEN